MLAARGKLGPKWGGGKTLGRKLTEARSWGRGEVRRWVGGLQRLETAPEKRSLSLHPPPPGTYLTHEAKGSDDAPDADTAIINAEGGQSGGDDKKEYFI